MFAGLGLGIAIAVGSSAKSTKRTSSSSSSKDDDDDDDGGDYYPDYPSDWNSRADIIWDISLDIAAVTGWTDLPEFFLANAYTESRGNPLACAAPCKKNSARGLVQLRPTSGFAGELEYLVDEDPDLLFDPRWNLALGAWYLYRLRNYAHSGQTIDWLALRRGEALPRLVKDVDEEASVSGYADGERSADVRERLEKAVYAVGLPESFIYQQAFPSGFQWPGINAVLDAVGASAPAPVSGRRQKLKKVRRMAHRNQFGERVFEVRAG